MKIMLSLIGFGIGFLYCVFVLWFFTHDDKPKNGW